VRMMRDVVYSGFIVVASVFPQSSADMRKESGKMRYTKGLCVRYGIFMCVDDSVAEVRTAPRTWRSWILMDIAYILSIRHSVGLCVPLEFRVCVWVTHTRMRHGV